MKMLYVSETVFARLVACTLYLPAVSYCAFLTCKPELVAVTPVTSELNSALSFNQVTSGFGMPPTLIFSANVSLSLCVILKPRGLMDGLTIRIKHLVDHNTISYITSSPAIVIDPTTAVPRWAPARTRHV